MFSALVHRPVLAALVWGLGAFWAASFPRPVTAADDTAPAAGQAVEQNVTQGALRIVQKDGTIVECPLKHTDVQADVVGFVARVRATQTFQNPTKEKIEAVYVFPLPHEAAVDDMTMVIGERKIVGLIKRRNEARAIYDQAVAAGQTAALLEQERPNIFTQSVGNIEPGQEVKIEIGYVDVLRYDVGTYEFHFPMVVGPRYIPGTPSGAAPPLPAGLQGKTSPPAADTDRVPDASRISPPLLRPEFRNGHDVSLSIKLDAGVPIQNLRSPNHQAAIKRDGERAAQITLSPLDSVPNKDFVLRYSVIGKKPEMAMLAHTGNYSGDRQKLGNGYFMLMIQPQEDERLTKSPPREIVFLVDVSGSMSGQPTNKVIEAMQGMLKLCRPQDTVQVVTFASQANKLFEKPLPVTEESIRQALNFTAGIRGSGGTEMLKGVKLAIDEPLDKERLRIVVMLTDGYIGNEAEIIEHVGKGCGDQIRFWCVGIGSSPNMFLVDGVAKQGGGMGKKLGLEDDSQALTQEIMTRIQRAQLAKLQIDWGSLKVAETFPAKLPELWAGRPVIVYGRFAGGGQAEISISGNVEGQAVRWPLAVTLPKEQKDHDALAKVWARQKIEDLMQQTYYQGSPAVEEMVTALALDYRLMSQYTSFVAVDSSKARDDSQPAKPPRRMLVPVPLPEGTQWEGFFGEGDSDELAEFRWKDAVSGKKELEKLSVDRLSAATAPLGEVRLRLARVDRFAAPTRLADRPALFGDFKMLGGIALDKRSSPMGDQARSGRRLAESARGAVALGDGSVRSLALGFEAMREAKGVNSLSVAGGGSAADFEYLIPLLTAEIGEKVVTSAQKAFEAATSKDAPADRAALRRLLEQACLLDTAAASIGNSEGQIAEQALNKLDELHQLDVKDWAAKLPQLQTKLDLVLRDRSLAEAIAAVAQAAKLDIRVLEGSLQDSATLLGTDSPRVSYLDLRRATVAEALDWILQPARLTWKVDAQAVVAGSQRRQAGESGWIYDVQAIATPPLAELQKLNDQNKAQATAKAAADELLAALRTALKADEATALWFGPGQILVFGTPERHAAAAQLIATLQQGGEVPDAALAKLAAVTRKRFADRKDKLAETTALTRKLAVAAAHDHFSWPLLAEAAGGRLDLEALTELQIAWRSPQTAELLTGPARPLVLRSLWTICEASRLLPDNAELATLAKAARQQSQAAAASALADAEKDAKDATAIASIGYALLANPDDSATRAKAQPLLAAKTGDAPPVADLRLVARCLAAPPSDADRQALTDLIARGIGGSDEIALTALAARRSMPHWQQFRANSRDLLGDQPLPGHLVVLINRLARPENKP